MFAVPVAALAAGAALASFGVGQRGGAFFVIGLAVGAVYALFGAGSSVGFGIVLWSRVVPRRHRELVVSWVVATLVLGVLTVRVVAG